MIYVKGWQFVETSGGGLMVQLVDEYLTSFCLHMTLLDAEAVAAALSDHTAGQRKKLAIQKQPMLESDVVEAIDKIRRQGDAV
jgi:hypothetical protein